MPQAGPAPRSAADVSTLLVELGRAMRGLEFYAEGERARSEILERSFQAWRAELARSGPLRIEVRRGAFWIGGSDIPVGRGRLDELARCFARRDVRRLDCTPDLEPEAFQALAGVLVTDPTTLEEAGGVEAWHHAAERRGVRLNGTANPEAGYDDDTAPVLGPTEELALRLSELDACDADAPDPQLVERIITCAARLDRGPREALHRGLRMLSDYAGDGARRSAGQRDVARRALRSLTRVGAVRDDLIERACRPDAAESMPATGILLRLGDEAAAPVLDRLEHETDAQRRGHLEGILIALGDDASTELLRTLDAGGPRRVRLAVRLAGEGRNQRAVPDLSRLLAQGEPDVRREAAKALVQIGDGSAMKALVQALESPVEGVPEHAAYCLGATRRPAAVRPLLVALDRALRTRDGALSLEIVRALGRLGRSEAASALAALLRRRSFFGRGPLLELKLAAVESLGRMPGGPAELALTQAARSRDARLRVAAERALASR